MKIAIIGPAFFGYLARLADDLSARGFAAEFIDELPSNKVASKVFTRLAPKAVRNRSAREFYDAMYRRLVDENFTHLVLVSVEMFPASLTAKLAARGVHVVRYAWDSNRNKPHGLALDPFAEKVASFDPQDCETYGYEYVPLYSNLSPADGEEDRSTDFSYCTTFHSQRPAWVDRLLKACEANGWSHDFMLFYHSRPLWFARFAAHPRLWHLAKHISTTPFPPKRIKQATARSRVVVDIHHHGQAGLTMRTFEAISQGCAVLTTNPRAKAALPLGLADRVALLRRESCEADMRAALEIALPPLTAEQRYYISNARFADQIIALLGLSPCEDASAAKSHESDHAPVPHQD